MGEIFPAVYRALAALILAGGFVLMFCGITAGVYFDRRGRLPFGVGFVVPFARHPGRHRLAISFCLVVGAVTVTGLGVDLLFEAATQEACQGKATVNPNEMVTLTVRVPRSGVAEIEDRAAQMRTVAGHKPTILDQVVTAFMRCPGGNS